MNETRVKVTSRVRLEVSGNVIVGKSYEVRRHDAAGSQYVIGEDGAEVVLRRGEFDRLPWEQADE